jgi:hypothetical protein
MVSLVSLVRWEWMGPLELLETFPWRSPRETRQECRKRLRRKRETGYASWISLEVKVAEGTPYLLAAVGTGEVIEVGVGEEVAESGCHLVACVVCGYRGVSDLGAEHDGDRTLGILSEQGLRV